MTDKEILEELVDQKIWWSKRMEECEVQLKDCERQLAKVNRLIEIIEKK